MINDTIVLEDDQLRNLFDNLRNVCGCMTRTWVFADECRDIEPKDMANQIIDVVGEGPTYLSFDLDALDSVANASSSAVEPFGLDHIWIYDVLKHLRLSNRIDLVGGEGSPET